MSEDESKKDDTTLEWKDYVALIIASIETIFLPLVILLVIMVGVLIILR